MATHGDIGLSQPAASTITMRLRSVTVNVNSTVVHQEVMTLGGAESTLEVARVMAGTPGSTDYGLVVREAAHSTGPFQISSVAGVVAISTVGGVVATSPVSTAAMTLRIPTVFVTLSNSTVGNSTDTTIISSAATVPYVSAYTVSSTEAGPIQCGFFKGSTLLWPLTVWANGGMNLLQAVSPPGFVFKGAVNRPINFKITSGSTGTIRVGVTYRQE